MPKGDASHVKALRATLDGGYDGMSLAYWIGKDREERLQSLLALLIEDVACPHDGAEELDVNYKLFRCASCGHPMRDCPHDQTEERSGGTVQCAACYLYFVPTVEKVDSSVNA
jgi:hypothetical protein